MDKLYSIQLNIASHKRVAISEWLRRWTSSTVSRDGVGSSLTTRHTVCKEFAHGSCALFYIVRRTGVTTANVEINR